MTVCAPPRCSLLHGVRGEPETRGLILLVHESSVPHKVPAGQHTRLAIGLCFDFVSKRRRLIVLLRHGIERAQLGVLATVSSHVVRALRRTLPRPVDFRGEKFRHQATQGVRFREADRAVVVVGQLRGRPLGALRCRAPAAALRGLGKRVGARLRRRRAPAALHVRTEGVGQYEIEVQEFAQLVVVFGGHNRRLEDAELHLDVRRIPASTFILTPLRSPQRDDIRRGIKRFIRVRASLTSWQKFAILTLVKGPVDWRHGNDAVVVVGIALSVKAMQAAGLEFG